MQKGHSRCQHRCASRKIADLLMYELIYRYVIPHKIEELDRISFPPYTHKTEELVNPPQAYSLLVLPSFSGEKDVGE